MKTVQIKSNIWLDDWFLELNSDEKVVWLYLLSNDQCNIAGIYKVTPATIKRMTDIPLSTIKKILKTFSDDRKAYLFGRHIIIANRIKYNTASPNITAGVIEIIKNLPKKVINFLFSLEETAIFQFCTQYVKNDRVSHAENDTLSHAKNDTLSHVEKDTLSDSILLDSIQSHSILHNAEAGWTESFQKIFSEIMKNYNLWKRDKAIIDEMAKTKEGRAEITELYTKIEIEGVDNKRKYLMAAISKNSEAK